MASEKTVNFNNNGVANIINQAGENMYINNIQQSEAIKPILIELTNLLSASLIDKEAEIQIIKKQLIEQSTQPKEKRDSATIKAVLGTISGYIGMLGAVVTQAGHIKQLFEQVKIFFGF